MEGSYSLEPVTELKAKTCADFIVNYLHQLGIEKVFGVPGGAIEPFLNALTRASRFQRGPELVVTRHECGAAFMADGYYRETGKMGVVFATTGPGSTNLITGVSSAMAEHVPLLVITAQTALPKFGRGALQESSCTAIDTVGMMKFCTRFTTLVSHPEQIESKLISAVMATHRNPPAPAHISIPSDVLNMPVSMPSRIHADLFSHDFQISDDRAIDVLCKKVRKVDTIVVYFDVGAKLASKHIIEFCQLVNAPFVVGQTGKYWVDERHPLYRGVYGFAGHASARELFVKGKVDLIIAVGTALSELATAGWDNALLNTKLVHIDSDAEHFTRSPMANHHVCGDARAIFNKLNSFVRDCLGHGKRWEMALPQPYKRNGLGTFATLDKEPDLGSRALVKGSELMAALSLKLPETARVYMDAGNSWAWMTHYYVNRDYQGRVRAGMEYGAMGWGVGAAIGSAFANSAALTVLVVGDGAYLMSAQELSVAVQYQLPVVFVILNDSALGMVMHGQRLARAESVGWQLGKVNYALQARSMGATGIVVHRVEQIMEMNFNDFLQLGPVVLDVRVDREEVPPIGQRVEDLGNVRH